MMTTTRKCPQGFYERYKHSLEVLIKSQRLALSYSKKGFYLAFSGGKDSQALYHLAKDADVQFEAHFNLTTIDPPEQVYFVREHYPEVIIDRPEITFSQLCIKKKALPTRLIRFCCSILKETRGAGTVTLTGVRREESTQRSHRGEAEINTRRQQDRFRGSIEQLDQFTMQKEDEGVRCIRGKDKIIINPIIEWSEADVWYYLNEVKNVPHCRLYDEGWSRIGCLFCPMASNKDFARMEARYPRHKNMFMRTIHKLRENGYMAQYPNMTVQQVWQWWRSNKTIKDYYTTLNQKQKQ